MAETQKTTKEREGSGSSPSGRKNQRTDDTHPQSETSGHWQ